MDSSPSNVAGRSPQPPWRTDIRAICFRTLVSAQQIISYASANWHTANAKYFQRLARVLNCASNGVVQLTNCQGNIKVERKASGHPTRRSGQRSTKCKTYEALNVSRERHRLACKSNWCTRGNTPMQPVLCEWAQAYVFLCPQQKKTSDEQGITKLTKFLPLEAAPIRTLSLLLQYRSRLRAGRSSYSHLGMRQPCSCETEASKRRFAPKRDSMPVAPNELPTLVTTVCHRQHTYRKRKWRRATTFGLNSLRSSSLYISDSVQIGKFAHIHLCSIRNKQMLFISTIKCTPQQYSARKHFKWRSRSTESTFRNKCFNRFCFFFYFTVLWKPYFVSRGL